MKYLSFLVHDIQLIMIVEKNDGVFYFIFLIID